MDPSQWLPAIAVPMLVALLVASRGLRTDERYVERWASSAGLELTADAEPRVRRDLAWTRACRTVGGLVGFMTPIVYATFVSEEPFRDGGWSVGLMLIGYLAGAFFAELVDARREHREGPSSRSLRQGDYMPASMLILQRGLAILSGVLALAYLLVERHASPSLLLPDPVMVGAFGAAGLVTALLLELLQRRVAVRRHGRPDMPPAVGDALASSSIHAIAGAGIALLLPNATMIAAVSLLALTDAATLAPALGIIVFAAFLGSLANWLHLAKPHGFRITRGEPRPVSASRRALDQSDKEDRR